MNLTRWEPFEAMDLMFNRFPGLFRFGRPQLATGEYFDWSPATDISETDKEYLIRAALPAVKKEDVKVTYENGLLTLSGERRQKEEQRDEKLHRVESYYGNFSRSVALPDVIEKRQSGQSRRTEYCDSRTKGTVGGEEAHHDQSPVVDFRSGGDSAGDDPKGHCPRAL